MTDEVVPLPPWLLAPVSREHRPPVQTKAQILPFGELDPLDFERLCVVLASEDGDPEVCRLYGTPGQAQDGIDVFARLTNGRYATYQCKRYRKVRVSDIDAAVHAFDAGEWKIRSERFVFCTSQRAVATELTASIEQHAARLKGDAIDLEVWDAEELSRRLKSRPKVVLDFFGRAWVKHFCTGSLSTADEGRLDGAEIAKLRGELRQFYERLFARQDALVRDGATLAERFVQPDVIRVRRLHQQRIHGGTVTLQPSGTGDRDVRPPVELTGTVDALVSERVTARGWLEVNQRALLIGAAGTGKSTLLRWLCLELLAAEPQTSGPAGQDGAFLAVWLPFGRWVSYIADGERDVSLPEALRRFFHSYAADDLWALVQSGLDDRRLTLLVDGLDEWSDESAADIAADRLQQYLIQRSVPALACTRPEGLRVLRAIDPEWSTAELAPLTNDQQLAMIHGLGVGRPDANTILGHARANPRLRRISANPLLLGLLARLSEADIALPDSGQEVFGKFISWLVRVQAPARRRVAEIPNPLELDDDELERALGVLALEAQRSATPAVSEAQARQALIAFLRGEPGLELAITEARSQAKILVEQARGPIGLLSELEEGQLVFAHRALQEHLTGRALSRLNADAQYEVAAARAREPSWRNALEALVWMAPNGDHADALIQAVQESPFAATDGWTVMPLLAQLALGASRASVGARAAALDTACEFVRADDRPGPRAEIVDLLVAGAESPVGSEALAKQMGRWWPCREESREGLVDATYTWPSEPATVEMWWRALHDEDTATSRKAAALIVDRCRGQKDAGERLASILRAAIPPHTRATALEALSHGWQERGDLARWIARARASADPNLRLVAIDHIVRVGEPSGSELEVALALADSWMALDYQRHGQIGEVLALGWPQDERIRRAALVTVDDSCSERPLDITLATWILLHSYSDHPEVIAWVSRALAADHPFVTMGTDAWRLVGENFRNQSEVVAALESRFETANAVHMPDLCRTALGLRTHAARDYLLRVLNDHTGWPSLGWPFGTLVDGWATDDRVMDALRDVARSSEPKVRDLAHWIDDVLPEGEATAVLFELAADPANTRAATALDALSTRTDPSIRRRALEVGLRRRSERPSSGPLVVDVLLSRYAEHPEVLDVATDELQTPGANLRAVALAAQHYPTLRVQLREMAVPLSVDLRRRLTQRLFEVRPAVATDSLAASWRLESDGMAAAAAGSARAALVAPADLRAVSAEAIVALHARKLDREAEGQAGLCVLLELGGASDFADQRFGHAPDAQLWIEFGPLRPNWWMASRVAAHFCELQSVFGNQLLSAFNADRHPHGFWSALAPFAAELPDLRAATLEFVRQHGAGSYPELLRFLAAVRPGSRELADALLDAVTATVIDRSQSRTALLLAAEMLAAQFSTDDQTLEALCERAGQLPVEGQLLALAVGWRRDPRARKVFEQARRVPVVLSTDVWVRLQLMLAGYEEALDALSRWLTYGEGQSWLVAPPTSIALKRTAGDAHFAERLAERVRTTERPSEKGSGARLLASAGRLDSATSSALAGACEDSMAGSEADLIGLDIFAEELRPLAWTLWDAVHGASSPT